MSACQSVACQLNGCMFPQACPNDRHESSPRTPPPSCAYLFEDRHRCGYIEAVHDASFGHAFEPPEASSGHTPEDSCNCEDSDKMHLPCPMHPAKHSSGRTPEVSEEARRLLEDWGTALRELENGSGSSARLDRAEHALLEYVARLESRLGEAERDAAAFRWLCENNDHLDYTGWLDFRKDVFERMGERTDA